MERIMNTSLIENARLYDLGALGGSKSNIEQAANSVKEALKGDDTAAIKAASEKLNEVWQAVSTELYKNAGDKSKESSATADTSTTNTGASGSGKDEGPIIDAEVVDEKKK